MMKHPLSCRFHSRGVLARGVSSYRQNLSSRTVRGVGENNTTTSIERAVRTCRNESREMKVGGGERERGGDHYLEDDDANYTWHERKEPCWLEMSRSCGRERCIKSAEWSTVVEYNGVVGLSFLRRRERFWTPRPEDLTPEWTWSRWWIGEKSSRSKTEMRAVMMKVVWVYGGGEGEWCVEIGRAHV